MREKIRAMLEMQDAMNTRVNPDWRRAGNAWYRAIWTECAELLDHHGWKWWKNQARDGPQVHLEIVDIWHFVMSDLLLDDESGDAAVDRIADAFADAIATDPAPRRDLVGATEALAAAALKTRRADPALFAAVAAQADLSFDDMYVMYIGKNTLNMFRQDHGYKTGGYTKTWDGKEDNEHLADVLRQLDPNTPDFAAAVYQRLQAAYPTTP